MQVGLQSKSRWNYTLSVDGSHSETIAGSRTETVTGDNTKTGKTINLN